MENNSVSKPIHSGAISLFEAGIWISISLIVLVIAISVGGGLFNKNDTSTELGNISELLNNTRNMLKTGGSYQFSSADSMTGTLLQFGGAPGNMAIVGEKSSGNAKLQNVWGNPVIISPYAPRQDITSGFSITYQGVPQESCTTLATRLGGTQLVSGITINGVVNNGTLSAASIGAACQSGKGNKDNNEMIFYSNQ